MKYIQAKISDEDYVRFRNLAFESKLTMSELIYNALISYADINEAIIISKKGGLNDNKDNSG